MDSNAGFLWPLRYGKAGGCNLQFEDGGKAFSDDWSAKLSRYHVVIIHDQLGAAQGTHPISKTMDLFSRRRWTTGSSQQSNMDGKLPCMRVKHKIIFRFVKKTTAYHLDLYSLHLLLLKRSMAKQFDINYCYTCSKQADWLNLFKQPIIMVQLFETTNLNVYNHDRTYLCYR